MRNLYAIFAKSLNICKRVIANLDNESGNMPRKGMTRRFSDHEIMTLKRVTLEPKPFLISLVFHPNETLVPLE